MRTLIDKLLGKKREQSALAMDRRAETELRQARKEFLKSAHRYSRTVAATLQELIETIDEERAEVQRLREGHNGEHT